MQCLSPFPIKNKNKDLKEQNLIINVPCGKCIPCRKRRSSHWSFRINQECKRAKTSSFLTLTYEEAPLSKNGFQNLVKQDLQKFFKKLRKLCPTLKKDTRLKYFACGEYGTKTQRPHYHAILFNLPKSIINTPQLIQHTWKNGHIHITTANEKTINYVVGYVNKGSMEPRDEVDYNTGEIIQDDRIKEFQLMSKGIGENYLTPQMIRYYKERKLFCIVHDDGHILSMPRYYKNKIFTKEELTTLYKEWIDIQSIKDKDFLELDGKRKRDVFLDLIRQREKQLTLNRSKL